MFPPPQITRTDPDESLRCRDSNQLMTEEKNGQNENARRDTDLLHEVDSALWKDAAFRATDYDNIDIRVRDGIVYLYGHVSSATKQRQAGNVVSAVDRVAGVRNQLVPDDGLLAEVATALGSLEHSYNCKFFTGVSHGVVMLSGNVDNAKVKLLAEQHVTSNPNVRGVINSICGPDHDLKLQDEPFLQPTIGEEIFFLDGVSGTVQHVIINPDNRRVVAMTIKGRFADGLQEFKAFHPGEALAPQRVIVLSMNLVRYLTKVSGFLYIKSGESSRYMDFDPTRFCIPTSGWRAPYPYCPGDVLFPVEQQDAANQILQELSRPATAVVNLDDQLLMEQLTANHSLGG
jgi:osmotically-inducible protein OsmY